MVLRGSLERRSSVAGLRASYEDVSEPCPAATKEREGLVDGAKRLLPASESRSSTAVPCCRRRFPCPEEGPRLSERSERVGDRATRRRPRSGDRRDRGASHNRPSVGPAAHDGPAAEHGRSALDELALDSSPRSGAAMRYFRSAKGPAGGAPWADRPSRVDRERRIGRAPLLAGRGRRVLRRGASRSLAPGVRQGRVGGASSCGQRAHCARSTATPPPDMETACAPKTASALRLSLAGSSRFAPGGQAPHCVGAGLAHDFITGADNRQRRRRS